MTSRAITAAKIFRTIHLPRSRERGEEDTLVLECKPQKNAVIMTLY